MILKIFILNKKKYSNNTRTDNIWNISIIIINDQYQQDNNIILQKNDIVLVINFVSSMLKIYNFDTDHILRIYREISR